MKELEELKKILTNDEEVKEYDTTYCRLVAVVARAHDGYGSH